MANTEGSVPFGVLLRQYRVAAGFSQEVLAERAGVSRRGISDLERGERRLPHPSTVRRLGEALELDPEARATLLGSSRAHETPIATPRPGTSAPAAARSQLPSAVSSFVGRERELADLAITIARVRLLTLTGPGAVSRLASRARDCCSAGSPVLREPVRAP
ncbi:MAG: helix-turn-helix domain-containing protein, partial [Chloroflexi bacterium]|nr:helix-turn-helix domain-containing protein [Chloroflexota bacterium]